jgi:hypothetical protein
VPFVLSGQISGGGTYSYGSPLLVPPGVVTVT